MPAKLPPITRALVVAMVRNSVMLGSEESFYDLIRAHEQRWRNRHVKRLRGLHVDHEVESSWPLDGQVRRPRAVEDFPHVDAAVAEHGRQVGPVGDEATGLDVRPVSEHRWQMVLVGKVR